MKTVSINVMNLCVPCENRCRYCLLSYDGKVSGVAYARSEAYAKRFYEWLKVNRPDLSFLFGFGYSMEHPELLHAIDFCQSIVLLFGPLYHLHDEADKLQCIKEAKRVCKPEGKVFFAFISNDIVILTMQQAHPDYLLAGAYDKETFRLYDFPFVFHTVDAARELLQKAGIKVCHQVAADGISELLQETINGLDEASYQQYLRYHFYICEKPEFLGMSNHLLFVGKKK